MSKLDEVCEFNSALTPICMFVHERCQLTATEFESTCVFVVWFGLMLTQLGPFFLESDPFGRGSRTNQIIVLVWH